MTIIANWSLFQGEDVQMPVTLYESDGVTIQNITGWTSLGFYLHKYGDPNTIFISKFNDNTNGIIINSETAAPQITITIKSADTALMKCDQYEYFIERLDPGANAELTKGLVALETK